ncbi:hypothetical protein BT69DRAFT_1384080 [Atractiella rhizophila]|nr:hypothetical protein BT69DRAFT_1384080 [Atractiella rhizophila]
MSLRSLETFITKRNVQQNGIPNTTPTVELPNHSTFPSARLFATRPSSLFNSSTVRDPAASVQESNKPRHSLLDRLFARVQTKSPPQPLDLNTLSAVRTNSFLSRLEALTRQQPKMSRPLLIKDVLSSEEVLNSTSFFADYLHLSEAQMEEVDSLWGRMLRGEVGYRRFDRYTFVIQATEKRQTEKARCNYFQINVGYNSFPEDLLTACNCLEYGRNASGSHYCPHVGVVVKYIFDATGGEDPPTFHGLYFLLYRYGQGSVLCIAETPRIRFVHYQLEPPMLTFAMCRALDSTKNVSGKLCFVSGLGPGLWRCSSCSGANFARCPHIQPAIQLTSRFLVEDEQKDEVYQLADLVLSSPGTFDATDTKGFHFDISSTIEAPRSCRRLPASVSLTRIPPAPWIALPEDTNKYPRPEFFTPTLLPSHFPYDSDGCCCVDSCRARGSDLPFLSALSQTELSEAILFTTLGARKVTVGTRRCVSKNCTKGSIGPDLVAYCILNYNNKFLFTHELLVSFLLASRQSMTINGEYWKMQSIYKNHASPFDLPSFPVILAAYYRYLDLLDFNERFHCPLCPNDSYKVVGGDGKMSGSYKDLFTAELQPPSKPNPDFPDYTRLPPTNIRICLPWISLSNHLKALLGKEAAQLRIPIKAEDWKSLANALLDSLKQRKASTLNLPVITLPCLDSRLVQAIAPRVRKVEKMQDVSEGARQTKTRSTKQDLIYDQDQNNPEDADRLSFGQIKGPDMDSLWLALHGLTAMAIIMSMDPTIDGTIFVNPVRAFQAKLRILLEILTSPDWITQVVADDLLPCLQALTNEQLQDPTLSSKKSWLLILRIKQQFPSYGDILERARLAEEATIKKSIPAFASLAAFFVSRLQSFQNYLENCKDDQTRRFPRLPQLLPCSTTQTSVVGPLYEPDGPDGPYHTQLFETAQPNPVYSGYEYFLPKIRERPFYANFINDGQQDSPSDNLGAGCPSKEFDKETKKK